MRGRVRLFYNPADDALRVLRLVVHKPSEWEDYSVAVCEKVTVVSVTNFYLFECQVFCAKKCHFDAQTFYT